MWLHPGRPPATGAGLAAAVQALQELQVHLTAMYMLYLLSYQSCPFVST